MHPYILPIAKSFKQYAQTEKAAGAKAYMRNQFEYFGLTAPVRQSISKTYLKESLPVYTDLGIIIKELWDLPQREFQYFGLDLIAALKKQWTPEIIDLLEFIILQKSWWDTVDFTASNLIGHYFKLFPAQIINKTGKWNRSDNLWLQRTSILFQLKYKNDTDILLLSRYILPLTASKEFFIQKAIGWALREYSKSNPGWVTEFVNQNKLAPLSKREALKSIHRNT